MPLLFLELVLRLFGPVLPGNYELGLWREGHPIYRRFHVRGGQAWLKTPEYVTHPTFNQFGLRGDEITQAKPAGTFRLMMLGDSFVESIGVSNTETASARLQALARAGGREQTQVLNAGVYGWGPAEELLYLRHEGLDFAPDLVVMVLYVGNDISNSLPRGASELRSLNGPYIALDAQGQLVEYPWQLIEPPGGALGQFARAHLNVYRAFETGVLEKFQDDATDLTPRRMAIYRDREPRELTDAYRSIDAMLGAMQAESLARGAELMLVIAPTKFQVHREDWDAIRSQLNLRDSDGWELRQPGKRLAAMAQQRSIPVVDLLGVLRDAASAGERLYYPVDGHWNAAGNRVAAQAIAEFVQSSSVAWRTAGGGR